MDDAMVELAEVRDYLADPDRFTNLGRGSLAASCSTGPRAVALLDPALMRPDRFDARSRSTCRICAAAARSSTSNGFDGGTPGAMHADRWETTIAHTAATHGLSPFAAEEVYRPKPLAPTVEYATA